MMISICCRLDIGEDPDQSLLSSQEIVDLSDVLGSSESAIFTVLRDVLQSSTWVERPRWFPALKGLLLRQCARYLYVAKKRGYVLNPVGMCATVVCYCVKLQLLSCKIIVTSASLLQLGPSFRSHDNWVPSIRSCDNWVSSIRSCDNWVPSIRSCNILIPVQNG